jgi:hypothetical protein
MGWLLQSDCQINGRRAQILFDDQYLKIAPIQQLTELSWIGVFCQNPPGHAFWDPQETESLDKLEDIMLKLCEILGDGWIAYVFRIATPGLREYYFYHSNDAAIRDAYSALKALQPKYRIEFDSLYDPSWLEYRKYSDIGGAI